MDAMFQPKPHGAIAVDPLPASPYDFPEDVNCLATQLFGRGVPNFFNCRRSLAASASSQSRNVTIFGSVAVAFGQMIQ